MAFLDELGKVISDKSKEAANKVKDITGVIQLKSKLILYSGTCNRRISFRFSKLFILHER